MAGNTTYASASTDFTVAGVYTTNDTIWSSWTQTTTATGNVRYETMVQPMSYTPEQIAAQERIKAERKEKEQKAKEALERSKQLLLSMLDEEQTAEFVDKGWFHVVGKDSRYRIKQGTAYNVEQYDESGKHVRTLCCLPNDNVPLFDIMLAQMLYIQHKEKSFITTANKRTVP